MSTVLQGQEPLDRTVVLPGPAGSGDALVPLTGTVASDSLLAGLGSATHTGRQERNLVSYPLETLVRKLTSGFKFQGCLVTW